MMGDDDNNCGNLDPWDAAHAALEERAAGYSPRPMLSRVQAMEKADAFLRGEGDSYKALGATPNPLQGLWIVDYHDPLHPDELIVGGSPLIVPTVGTAYWANGSAPPWPEDLGLEEPEYHSYEKGESLLGGGWDEQLRDELRQPYFQELLRFIADERRKRDVYPPPSQTFRAFALTPYDDVKVVILGQDPYPNAGQAHGLAFSVPSGVRRIPPSLRNIHRVLTTDLGVPMPDHGSLESWAAQGVLLLNTALTVRSGDRTDRVVHRRWRHDGKGWADFTDAVVRAVNGKPDREVFVLWGRDAQKKARLIDLERHAVIESTHPSP